MANNNENKVLNVPNLRFPEFSGEWKKCTIDDLCEEFKSGKNIKADNILNEGEYPVFGGNGLRGYTDCYNHEGDYVLIGRQGALCGNIRFVTGKTYITEHAIAAKATNNNNTRFLESLFIQLNLGKFSDQSAQPGLAVNKLLKIETSVPSKDEQEKIASLLQNIDKRIATQTKSLTSYSP
ncbi:restriction endonuclease subunit S [Bacteroides fragilis]|nr:restriction endonuclease subunit S [Bacteroides fragilis]